MRHRLLRVVEAARPFNVLLHDDATGMNAQVFPRRLPTSEVQGNIFPGKNVFLPRTPTGPT